MKKIGLLFITLFITTLIVNAQPPQFDPEEIIKLQVERLTEACDLSKDQVPKVEAIVRETNEKMMEMFQGGQGGDFAEMREKMEKVQEEQAKKMKEVLSDDQDKKYDKYLEEQRERMRQMGGGFGG